MKLGVQHVEVAGAAARATGPIEQWGATRRSWTAARAATFLAARMPPAVGHVRLHHVGGAQGDEPVEVRLRVQPLPRRQGAARPPLDLGQQVQRLGRQPAPRTTPARKGSSLPIMSIALPAVSRPWNSIIRPTPGPHGRAHGPDALERRLALLGVRSFQAVPNGSNLRAR